jgi:hypothetical protein
MLRCLLPDDILRHEHLVLTIETLVRDQLRREERARQRATEPTQRGPPKQPAGAEA